MSRSILALAALAACCAVTGPLAGEEAPPSDDCTQLQVWKHKDKASRQSYGATVGAARLTACLEKLRVDLIWVADFLKAKAALEKKKAEEQATLKEALEKGVRLAKLCDEERTSYCGSEKPDPPKDPWQFPIVGSRSQGRASDGSRELLDVRRYLLEAYDAYKHIDKLYQGPCEYPKDAKDADADARLCALKTNTRVLWKSIAPGVGIDNRISGVIVPSLGVTRTHGDKGAETKFEQKAFVRWATRPFGGSDRAAFRIAGRLGFDPVFNMTESKTADNGVTEKETVTRNADGSFTRVGETTEKVNLKCEVKDGEEDCKPSVTESRPEYSAAFVWDIGPDLFIGLGGGVELTVGGRAGQALSLQDFATPDKDQPDVRVFADFDTDSRWYFDYGARLALYPDGVSSRATRRLAGVRPVAELVWIGREDRRLKGLTDKGRSERRQILRFTLNRLPVFGLDGDKPVDLTFAVEHEWGYRGGRLPSGTRIYLQSSIDLKRIF
jgi:hypothetical protein